MTDEQNCFRSELLEAGLLWSTGIDGLYLRSATYESVLKGVDSVITEAGRELEPLTLHAPLPVPRTLLEQSGYVNSFPDLLGTVSGFSGGQSEFAALLGDLSANRDWSDRLSTTSIGLCSAVCHSIYPLITKPVPGSGSYYEVFGQCYRHEPSVDPFRLQAFHMHELVCVADPAVAYEFREHWLHRCLEMLSGLQLEIYKVIANDPFFGKGGALLAQGQRAESLKFELVSPIYLEESPTAITSVNLHLDHFGTAFDIRTDEGVTADSACLGFGVDRIALALFRTHGLVPDQWPAEVREQLKL